MTTRRYAAFLRGVSPMNLTMPALKQAFELAGFTEVKTLLSSGNVTFTARSVSAASLERRAEAAMKAHLGREFTTFVRSVDALRGILAADPYAAYPPLAGAKRVVTFLRDPKAASRKLTLPIERDGARVLCVRDTEVYGDYDVATSRGPAFMALLEKTFGAVITTRTWETVRKAATQAAQSTTPRGPSRSADRARASSTISSTTSFTRRARRTSG